MQPGKMLDWRKALIDTHRWAGIALTAIAYHTPSRSESAPWRNSDISAVSALNIDRQYVMVSALHPERGAFTSFGKDRIHRVAPRAQQPLALSRFPQPRFPFPVLQASAVGHHRDPAERRRHRDQRHVRLAGVEEVPSARPSRRATTRSRDHGYRGERQELDRCRRGVPRRHWLRRRARPQHVRECGHRLRMKNFARTGLAASLLTVMLITGAMLPAAGAANQAAGSAFAGQVVSASGADVCWRRGHQSRPSRCRRNGPSRSNHGDRHHHADDRQRHLCTTIPCRSLR